MKIGTLVTVKKWYMPRRVYGHVEGTIRFGFKRGYLIVCGKWGLQEFPPSEVKAVKRGAKIRADSTCEDKNIWEKP